jgi:hypothetical protein
MRDLTADVLAESRMAEAATELDRQPVELRPLLRRLMEERGDAPPCWRSCSKT